jgi:hypothetical protein
LNHISNFMRKKSLEEKVDEGKNGNIVNCKF